MTVQFWTWQRIVWRVDSFSRPPLPSIRHTVPSPQNVLDYFTIDLAAKIRWRKRFDRNPLLIQLQDKYAVRHYAASRGVAIPSLLHVTDDPATIPFYELPRDHMIKATHGWGWNIMCRDSRHYLFGDGRGMAGHAQCESPTTPIASRTLSHEEVRDLCSQWLKSRHARNEWAYQHIPPRIIVEELLTPRQGNELFDYRFYAFNGKVKALNVGSSRYRRDRLNVFFDPDWNLIELTSYAEALPPTLPLKPPTLPAMLEVAERLGKGLEFVRIDLYDTTRGVVLGEMTVYPESGNRGTPTSCRRFNQRLGKEWRMSPAGEMAVWGMNLAGFMPHLAVSLLRWVKRMVGA